MRLKAHVVIDGSTLTDRMFRHGDIVTTKITPEVKVFDSDFFTKD